MIKLIVLVLCLGFGAAVQAQHVGTPLVSTSTGGVVSGTYGYFQYISASSNNLTTTDSTKVAKTGDTMTGILTLAPAGVGTVSLVQGSVTNPGYVQFATSDTTRRGYLGWANGTNITLTAENSWGQSFITGGAERMRITAAGLLGIGTGSPSYKLDVHDTATDTSGGRFYNGRFYKYFNPASASSAFQTNLWVQCDNGGGANNLTGDSLCQYVTNYYQGTATLNAMYATYADVVNASTGTTTTARALQGNVTNNAGGTITNASGALTQVYNAAGGTIASAVGIQSQIVNGGAGTITNAFGLTTNWSNPTGTITNGYGIYLNDVNASTGWGIYQLGSNDGNYFAGKVGVGTAPTGYQFSVGGDIYSSTGWVRTTGTGGWYSETYGGGWHMTDSTWLRAYNSKSIYTAGTVEADTQVNTAQICNASGANCVLQSALGGSGSPGGTSSSVQVNTAGSFGAITDFTAGSAGWNTCTGSYSARGSSCYRLTTFTTRANAQTNCAADGGYLVKIDDTTERDAIAGITSGQVWSGLNDITTEGTFVWQDGTSASFTNWSGGEPNNSGGNEDCMQFNAATGMSWNDANCGGNAFGVCENPSALSSVAVNTVTLPGIKLVSPSFALPTCTSTLGGQMVYSGTSGDIKACIRYCSVSDGYGGCTTYAWGWRSI